jgi:hypothetical protein
LQLSGKSADGKKSKKLSPLKIEILDNLECGSEEYNKSFANAEFTWLVNY